MDRISMVRDMLSRAPGPVAPETLGVAFRGRNSARRTKGVEKALQTLVAAGVAQQGIDGQDGSSRFFIARQVSHLHLQNLAAFDRSSEFI